MAHGELITAILRFFETLDPAAKSVLAAVSGGPDSSCLLHALARIPDRPFDLHAVHVRHGLRGAESEGDARWVERFCRSLDVPLIQLDGRLDGESVRREGVEAAARRVRYRCLENARRTVGADWVATGHTRSDQAETVLLRLLTGRGAWRLSGILPVTETRVIRPMLSVSRERVNDYVREHGLDPRLDRSNDDSRFLRNRLRNEILPALARWNPKVEEILADTAQLELERSSAFEELLAPIRRELVVESMDAALLRLSSKVPPHAARTLILEQIRRLDPDAREVDAQALTAIAEGTPRMLSASLRAAREADAIRIERVSRPEVTPEYARPIAPGQTLSLPEAGFVVALREAPEDSALASGDRLRQVIQVSDSGGATFEIRNRRPGDRFRPLGMSQDKNLADFMIDRRIPVDERDSLPLLVCNGSIAWVAGVEVSDAFRVRRDAGVRLEVVAERIGGTA